MKPKTEESGDKLIVKNRRAFFDYEILDTYDAGLVLRGSEVKSMRAGRVDLSDAYVAVERGEAWLKQMFVAPFTQASAFPHEPRAPRKLLLHAREIGEIGAALARDGATAVPLRLYFKGGRVKAQVAVAKGKKAFDKRATIAKREADREARAAMRAGSGGRSR